MPNTIVSTLFSRLGHERAEDAQDAVDDQEERDDDGERDRAAQRIGDQVEADDDVQDPEDGHEHSATGRSIGCPCPDDLHRAAEHERDADDDRGDERGVDDVCQGDEADDHEENPDADEPLPATAEGLVRRGGHE